MLNSNKRRSSFNVFRQSIAMATVSLLFVGSAVAMPPPSGPNLERLSQSLSLSDDQKAQIKTILDKEQAFREQRKKIVDASIEAVLNPQQLTNFKTLQSQRPMNRGPRGEQRGHKGPRCGHGDRNKPGM